MINENIAGADKKNSYYCIYWKRVEDKKKTMSLCDGFTL